MFPRLAVAAVLVGMSVGSVAYGWTDVEVVEWRQDRANGFTEDGIPWENLTGPVTTIEDNPGGDFFDVYAPQGLTDMGADGHYPGYVEWDPMIIILDFDSFRR